MKVLEIKHINIPDKKAVIIHNYPNPGLYVVNKSQLVYVPTEEAHSPIIVEPNYRKVSIIETGDIKEEPKSAISENLLLAILDRTVNNPNK